MIELPPLYVPLTPRGNPAFAEALQSFAADSPRGSVLIVHAPTGAGKTRAIFPLAQRGGGVLITVPTNALAAEVEETYRRDYSTNVVRWTAASIVKSGGEPRPLRGKDRHDAMREHARVADLIVSNPDMLHLFTQNEHVKALPWARLALERMKDLQLVVFDEYHAYDERILAAVILYLMKGRGAGLNQKFVFMSATPDDGLQILLRALRIPFQETPPCLAGPEPPPGLQSRLIKGPLRLEVRGDPISASVPNPPFRGRSLFIFSTFAEQQRAVRSLLARGVPAKDTIGGFVEITGRETKSSEGQTSWNQASLLLATSKVDVGLNIESLDRVVMEPGWSEQQFWQRFGRAGRGRSAEVTLHFPGYSDSTLAGLRNATSYPDLTKEIRALLNPDEKHLDTILRYVGAYAACYHRNSGPSADAAAVRVEGLPVEAQRGFRLIATILQTAHADELADEDNGAEAWRQNVEWGLRGLRGTTLEAKAVYEWRPDRWIRESLSYILCRTEYTCAPDGSYVIHELLDHPREARLTYMVADTPLYLRIRGSIPARDFREQVVRRIETVIAAECGRPLPPFWSALCGWLAVARPNEIAPREMKADDIFL